MKKYITTILLASTFFISELHTFWEGRSLGTQNWILNGYAPMTLQWNIKYASMQANFIIWFLAWILYVPNKVNKTMVVTMLTWSIIDTIMYFYNFKNYQYGAVYLLVGVLFAASFFWKNITGCLLKNLHPK